MILLSKIHYFVTISFFIIGLYIIYSSSNLFKKVAGLVILQSSVLLLFISIAKVSKGKVPILQCLDFTECPNIYSNPLPHVLMLTAIVVGFATISIACALILQIDRNFGTIEEAQLLIRKDVK